MSRTLCSRARRLPLGRAACLRNNCSAALQATAGFLRRCCLEVGPMGFGMERPSVGPVFAAQSTGVKRKLCRSPGDGPRGSDVSTTQSQASQRTARCVPVWAFEDRGEQVGRHHHRGFPAHLHLSAMGQVASMHDCQRHKRKQRASVSETCGKSQGALSCPVLSHL